MKDVEYHITIAKNSRRIDCVLSGKRKAQKQL